mmetsp:Transcript_28264/g.100329  ORF Transcript_28264/g.100329 Transcript_28264/m.100329 type:complete len:267 (+) Transcript_28264:487-1287(+)
MLRGAAGPAPYERRGADARPQTTLPFFAESQYDIPPAHIGEVDPIRAMGCCMGPHTGSHGPHGIESPTRPGSSTAVRRGPTRRRCTRVSPAPPGRRATPGPPRATCSRAPAGARRASTSTKIRSRRPATSGSSSSGTRAGSARCTGPSSTTEPTRRRCGRRTKTASPRYDIPTSSSSGASTWTQPPSGTWCTTAAPRPRRGARARRRRRAASSTTTTRRGRKCPRGSGRRPCRRRLFRRPFIWRRWTGCAIRSRVRGGARGSTTRR